VNACVGAVILRQGKVLLGLRSVHRSLPNHWDMFGGHIEQGETELEALSRELEEELGIRPTQLARIAQFSLDQDNQPINLAVYEVREWIGGEPHMLGDEHSEIAWFTFSEAAQLPNLSDQGLGAMLHTLQVLEE
jgi:8-oxo-dGTP diphosphatase